MCKILVNGQKCNYFLSNLILKIPGGDLSSTVHLREVILALLTLK